MVLAVDWKQEPSINQASLSGLLAQVLSEQEEERRLFYVAITRAERYLYLTYPLAMFRYDGYKSLKPSTFITNIDSKLLQLNDLARSATYAAEDGIEYVAESSDYLPAADW